MGTNRPNENDILKIEQLAKYIKENEEEQYTKSLEVKGNYPYCEYRAISLIPQPNEKCSQCGSCVKKCPVEAIDKNTFLKHRDIS